MQDAKFEDVEECVEEVELKRNLWVGGKEWGDLVENWADMQFEQIDVAEMDELIQRYSKLTFKLERGLPKNNVVPRLKALRESL